MLKSFLLFTMVLGLSCVTRASTIPFYLANEVSSPEEWLAEYGIVPIPWGSEQPFPWDSIDGLWQATVAQKTMVVSNFEFKVVREEATGARQLYIREIVLESGKVIAEGVGLQRGKIVEAQMTTPSGQAYAVKIRSFSTKDYPVKAQPNQFVTNNNILMMSAGFVDRPYNLTHFHLGRIQ